MAKNLSKVAAAISKAQGEGSIRRLGDSDAPVVEVVSTGIPSLDEALGVGGFPRGRIIEIYGPESSGKTTLALQAIAEVQKMNGGAAFIDAEHAFDIHYAGKLGVDTDNLLVSQPDNGEQALEIADALVQSGEIDIIVVDSVAALVPKAELEGEMGDAQMGLQARLMSQALRKLTGNAAKKGTIIVFLNQLRSKIGVMFGNPETTTGGNALKFYASVRLDVRRIQTIKSGEDAIANRVKIKVVKNKTAPPYRVIETDLVFGEGFSRVSDILELATRDNLIVRSGSWFEFQGERFQGREAMRDYLKENPALVDDLHKRILKK